jgi:hypothetical protein
MSQGTTIQASDDEFEAVLTSAMLAVDLRIGRRNPRGTIPGGEAEVVHRGGGRYVSVIGSNALFHNPADRGQDAVNVGEIARFAAALPMSPRSCLDRRRLPEERGALLAKPCGVDRYLRAMRGRLTTGR